MWHCLWEASKDNKDVLAPDYWSPTNTSDDDIRAIFTIDSQEPPMMEERIETLRSIAHYYEKTGKTLFDLYTEANGSAQKFIASLKEISCFEDEPFFKKAQLFPTLLLGWKDCWDDQETISVCPDYKIPFKMRELGILEYSDELTEAIRKNDDLAETKMEQDIRTATVWAGELISNEFHKKGREDIFPLHVDKIFWKTAGKGEGELPTHYALTTKY